jgi:hypothetical protein
MRVIFESESVQCEVHMGGDMPSVRLLVVDLQALIVRDLSTFRLRPCWPHLYGRMFVKEPWWFRSFDM